MDCIDFQDEELVVTKAVGLAFHGLDLVVGAFQGTGGNGVVVVGQQAVGVEAKGSGKLLEHANAAGFSPQNPIQKERLGLLLIVLFPICATLP